jgi:hypothetical protein
MSVAARIDGDHFELLRQVRPADQQWFIEEVTQRWQWPPRPRTLDRCRTCLKLGP